MFNFNRNTRTEYHTITSDHPLMVDIGMSSFTLPQFVEWWYQIDYDGNWLNRQLFPGARDPYQILLGSEVEDNTDFHINAWRFVDYNKGKYVKYRIFDNPGPDNAIPWAYYNDDPKQDRTKYKFDDLNFPLYQEQQFNRVSKQLEDSEITIVDEKGLPQTFNYGNNLDPLLNIITMNDTYNIVGFEKDIKIDQAAKKFLQDIKRSKTSFLEWQAKISVEVNLIRGKQSCIIEEIIPFKLYLNDGNRPTQNKKVKAQEEIYIAAPYIGPDGTNQQNSEDGEHEVPLDGSPTTKAGGAMKTHPRPLSGKFSGGSEQIIGIVASDTIPAASRPLDIEGWDSTVVKDHFDLPGEDNFTPGKGFVVPMDMQNRNPYQWSPNYKNPKGCRAEDDTEKVRIEVWNLTQTEFKKNDVILLSDMYDLWCVFPIAESEPVETVPLLKDVTEWQFTYHITNKRFHFRYADPERERKSYDLGGIENPRQTSATAMEEAIAKKYLAARNKLNWLLRYEGDVSATKIDEGKTWPGYAQITGFDYMDKDFGGLRENKGNCLVITDNRRKPNGDLFGQFDDTGSQCGKWTVPFFGCTFPQGYDDLGKYNNLNGDVKDENGDLTGQGWRPGTQTTIINESTDNIDQKDSFFDLEMFKGDGPYGVDGDGYQRRSNPRVIGASEEYGVFDPRAIQNNESTNRGPTFFLSQQEKDLLISERGHVNLFSSEDKMYHLPADIATNGPFSSENGGPILNLNNVQKYITKAFDPLDPNTFWSPTQTDGSCKLYDSYHDFWLDPTSFQFLYDTIDRQAKENYSGDDIPILDFKPLQRRNVLFRPLRDAVFAQWDTRDIGGGSYLDPKPMNELQNCGFSNYFETSPGSRIGISSVSGFEAIFGPKTKERIFYKDRDDSFNKHHLIVPALDEAPRKDENVPAAATSMPFQYYLYKNEQDQSSEFDNQDGFALRLSEPLYYGSFIANTMGADDTLGLDDKCMGGFGVIGARCTAEAEGGFVFENETYIGQSFIFNVGTSKKEAIWGGRTQLQWFQDSTTQLFTKIYQAWPRDQTIFDSRFFAVHHFNEGNKLPVSDNKRPWQDGYRLDEVEDSETFPEAETLSYDPITQVATGVTIRHTSDITYTDILYVDKDATNIDTRIPCFFDKNPLGPHSNSDGGFIAQTGENLPYDDYLVPINTIGDIVFSEGVVTDTNFSNYVLEDETLTDIDLWAEQFDEEEQGDRIAKRKIYQPIAPTGYWKVDPGRRAKLLPWIYPKTTIGLPSALGAIQFDQVNDGQTLQEIVKNQNRYIIAPDAGKGYEKGQEMKVEGGNGTNAILIISETSEGGSIEELQWKTEDISVLADTIPFTYSGQDYLPEDFPEGSQSGITIDFTTDLAIVPVSGNNTTFVGYFVAGTTKEKQLVDWKPQLATETKDAYVLGTPNNIVTGVDNPTFRTEDNFSIIPIGGQAIAFGEAANTFFSIPQENIEPVVGRQVTTVVLDVDEDKSNPAVLQGTYPKYDLFFQFHSDISHQGIQKESQSFFENYMDMTINPF